MRIFRLLALILTVIMILYFTVVKKTDHDGLWSNVISGASMPFIYFSQGMQYFFKRPDSQDMIDKYHKLSLKYQQLEMRYKKISRLLNFKYQDVDYLTVAKVVSSADHFIPKIIRINAGSVMGIKPQDIAINHQGLVGRVVAVRDYSADILPLTHISSKVVGEIKGNGERVFLSGYSYNLAKVEYVTNNLALKENSIIVSRSDGKFMPPAIPIGKIINPFSNEIKIQFFVNFTTLDYIQIIRLSDAKNS